MSNTDNPRPISIQAKELNPQKGMPILILTIVLFVLAIVAIIVGGSSLDVGTSAASIVLLVLGLVYIVLVFPFLLLGLKSVNPNEAAVYVLFGKYHGTISKPGFFYVNPFVSMVNPAYILPAQGARKSDAAGDADEQHDRSKKISLKAVTLNSEKLKVNDLNGNPIEIGVIVIWRVVDATRAVFEVDNYKSYIAIQTDAVTRHIARKYPYDISTSDEETLRGSASEVADELKSELQSRAQMAGIEIIETQISHLAYAQEIAAAMLQRQQASAIIEARQKIVEGAVGMVEMALEKLSENDVVRLDDERKAAMVSNLLVILCGNKDAQPIVNSGSLY